jgi:hypothetical protein
MGIASKEFDEFVKRQTSSAAAQQAIDWDRERKDWIDHLDSLYNQIESFLSKYKKSIQIEYADIELNEENIGRYSARKMIIHIGRQAITLTPIGTLLIGARGGVDVAGHAGKARLLLVDKDAVDARSLIRVNVAISPGKPSQPEKESKRSVECVWKIATAPPVVRFIDLNSESFFQMVMEVSNA